MFERISPFLYRRLARFVTCQLRLPESGEIRLRSKWDVASFQDVFCHPFYWHALSHLDAAPKTVVDAGAHCGHFSILADTTIRARFPGRPANFVLVEPNPNLLPALRRNLASADMAGRTTVHQGLIGGATPQGTLWVDTANYLASGRDTASGRTPIDVPVINLQSISPDGPVDILKMDIEGSEFDFVRENPSFLNRVGLFVVEVHSDRTRFDREFAPPVRDAGLELCEDPWIGHAGCLLATFQRKHP